MNKQSQTEIILNKMMNSNPIKYFQVLDRTQNGMLFILVYLSKSNGDVYASTLAREMKISRARVTILIQKLLKKNLIEKKTSEFDSRIEIIGLTQDGIQKTNEIKKEIMALTQKIIDKIGIPEFEHYVDTSNKIISALKEK